MGDDEEEEAPTGIGTYEGLRNEEGERHDTTGKAVSALNNGDVYEGCFENGKRNGTGTYYFGGKEAAKATYTGNYIDHKKSGLGKMTYPDSTTYEGEWKDDKREGEQKPPHLAPLLLLLLRARGADARTRPQASASTRTRPVTRTRGSGRRARRLGPARTTARVPHPRLPASGWTARSGWPTGSSPTARGSAAPSAATAGRRASAAS